MEKSFCKLPPGKIKTRLCSLILLNCLVWLYNLVDFILKNLKSIHYEIPEEDMNGVADTQVQTNPPIDACCRNVP